MAALVNSVVIEAPGEVVFDYAVDLSNELEWGTPVHIVKLTDGPVRVGSRFDAEWEERRPDRSRLCRSGPAAPLGHYGTGSKNGRQPVRRRTGSWSDQVALNSDHGIAPTRLASGVASCAQARDAEDGREKSSSTLNRFRLFEGDFGPIGCWVEFELRS